MPAVGPDCAQCLLPFEPYPYLLTVTPADWRRAQRKTEAYVFTPRAGTCQQEAHYPGYGEVD